MGEADFWNNQEKAQATVAELKAVNSVLKPLEEAIAAGGDLEALEELAREDASLEADHVTEADRVEKLVDNLELTSLLSGTHDSSDALVSIHARDGGTDANDWAEMLLRMYSAWAAKHDYTVELLDRQDDAVAGIQSATVAIKGPWAYGYLKGETGIHRLVRISPFNAEGKRQTSFATVEVTPEFETTALTIPEKDIEVVAFVRASGPGGQNVNKVASAIRITHLPTGIQVVASTYRDQLQNKSQAFAVLQSKLEALEEERRQAELDAATGGKVDRGWGTQIRSYVFYDNRVKDHRTGVETSDYESVLRGDIADFIDAELKRRRAEKEAKK